MTVRYASTEDAYYTTAEPTARPACYEYPTKETFAQVRSTLTDNLVVTSCTAKKVTNELSMVQIASTVIHCSSRCQAVRGAVQ